MLRNHWTIRAASAAALLLCATLASAQLPLSGRTRSLGPPAPATSEGTYGYSPAPRPSAGTYGYGYSPPLGFNPYVANQQPTSPVIPGPALPPSPAFTAPSPALPVIPPQTVIQQPLPVYPVRNPVRLVFSGEYLYMRASDAAMTGYAVRSTSTGPIPLIPMGPVAALELDFNSGFRLGLDWVWNDYSRWVFNYTQLDMSQSDLVTGDLTVPVALQSLVVHPSTDAAGELFLEANASGELRLRLGDIEYRRIFVEDWYRWDFLVGARYANLRQSFNSEFRNPEPEERVRSSVNFDGGGIRFGTGGDWRSPRHGFFIYGEASTGFLAGRFRSQYSQTDEVGGMVAFTSRRDDRIINVTDLELGAGWHSPAQRWWFSGGYLFSTWSDVINNAGVIRAAQSSFYSPIRERLTFDGLAVRGELRF